MGIYSEQPITVRATSFLNSNFACRKLSQEINEKGEKVIQGLLGRFDGSPHNPTSRTEVYAFLRNK